MARPFNSSPADRLPRGSVLRPQGDVDKVLRGPMGHTTGDIRLTPSAATVVGSASYNFGKVTDRAIGIYRLEWQGAASATAEALGAVNRVEFMVYENTAGVYLCKIMKVADSDGGVSATADAHEVLDAADATVFAAAIADATISLCVLTSGLVTTAQTQTTGGTITVSGISASQNGGDGPAVGDLYLNDASATGTRVFSLTKLS